MELTQFKTTIEASPEKTWNSLWNDETYRKWTSVFSESSRAETDWKQGSKVLFVDDKNSGMVSTIVESRPNEFMSFRHLGFVKDGVEDTESEEAKEWAGAMENYTLTSVNGKTELVVDMDLRGMSESMHKYFMDTWPKALEKLKDVAEKN